MHYKKSAAIILFMSALLTAPGILPSATLSNQSISDAVEDEITDDRAVPADKIDVKTSEGVVTLSGTVDNILAKDRAGKIAETVKGVTAVRNSITVSPAEKTPDAVIVDRIKKAISMNPATDSYRTKVTVSKGIVTLSGRVHSYGQRQLAEKTAKSVQGVREVVNNIDVTYRAPRPDSEIESDIEQAFRWDALLYGAGIDVDVDNGAVKLSGAVASAAEKSRALSDASVPGVNAIDASGLDVSSWDWRNNMAGDKLVRKSDRDIREAIERRLLLDPQVNSTKLSAEVSKGVVTLRGSVESLLAKREAAEEARTTAGVVRVKNRIKVVPPQGLADDRIRDGIKGALAADPYVSRYNVGVAVINGTAALAGSVETYHDKLRAETVTAGVRGVTAIDNNLKIEDPGSIIAWDPYIYDYYVYDLDWFDYEPALTAKPDSEIKEDIGNEMFWSPFVDSDRITVKVDRGVATLTGNVDSWAEYQAATENALEGGATGVVNKLQITG